MSKKRAPARHLNALLRVVHTPMFKQRVVADKTKYKRKDKRQDKHQGLDSYAQHITWPNKWRLSVCLA